MKRTGRVAPVVAVLMAAGAAWGQAAPAQSGGRAGYDRPISGRTRAAAQPAPSAKTERHISISRTDETGVYTVTVDGDDIDATINGEEVPSDRIQQDEGRIRLLDKQGNVVAEFQVGAGKGGTLWIQNDDGNAGAWGLAAPGQGGNSVAVAGDPPPVMLGITMGSASDSLLDHLGLEQGTVVLIDRVYDGLPAAQGGMQSDDILVEIDGTKPLTEEKVREVLRSKKPGDEVKCKVLRKGATKELKIKLEAYDAGRLGMSAFGAGELVAPQDVQGLYNWAGPGGDDARKAIENALKSLGSARGADADAIRDTARKALEDALKSLDETSGKDFRFRFSPGPLSGSGGRVLLGPEPGQVYSMPRQPAAPTPPGGRNGDLSRQMDELRAQLDEVQRSRDELRAQLDDIKAMLKEMRDRDRR